MNSSRFAVEFEGGAVYDFRLPEVALVAFGGNKAIAVGGRVEMILAIPRRGCKCDLCWNTRSIVQIAAAAKRARASNRD